MDIRRGAFSANAILQETDFQAVSSKPGAAVVLNTPVNNWYSAELPSSVYSFINRNGVTQLRLRFGKDDNNDLSADTLNVYSGNAGAAVRPQLVIEYAVP